ncbi:MULTISPECIES: PH domain-containing protein [unclassified Corynebacterium]|uniref:PH domain-containing protein n=1 Tax=unclassified Corynebacterium TaxID=2624378 RepID=UPI0030B1CE15
MTATQKSTDNDQWEFVATSRILKFWAWGAVAVVMAIHIFMGYVVDIGDTGAQVTLIDRFAFPAIGVIISAACLLLLRPRIRANSRGVEVRNLLTPRFYRWDDVYGLSFPEDSRWARLELPDFEFVPVLALQAADQATVVRDVKNFRALEERYMPED